MTTFHALTAEQRDLAISLTDVMSGCTVDDAFTAIVAIVAATCNEAYDGGKASREAAASLAKRIVDTVDAGQRGELPMHGQVLQ